MNNSLIGKTVALTLAPVWAGKNPSEPTPMSGLFTLEEFCPYEPSNYCWSAGWWIVPVGDDSDEPTYWIEDGDLMEQIDPQHHGRMLVQEREMNFYEEDHDNLEDAFFRR